MADLTVEVRVLSTNQQTLVSNQLIPIKADSSTTCWDIILEISQKQNDGATNLLSHILTFICNTNKSVSAGDDTQNTSSPYIQVLASSSNEDDDDGTIIPLQKGLHPLLVRHQWTRISFVISDELTVQSQVFLSHIRGDSKPIATSDPHHNNNNSVNPYFDLMNDDDENEGLDHKQRLFHYQRFFNRSSPYSGFESLNEIMSLYHIFAAVLIIFLTGILTNEALEKGVLYRFDLLLWNFGQLDKVFLIWCMMMGYSFIFVGLFHQYKLRTIHRLNFGIIYGVLLCPLIYVPYRLIRHLDLPAASAAIVACEQVRILMKIHAYMSEMFRAAHYGENFHNLTGSGNNEYTNAAISRNEYSYLRRDWIKAWEQCMKVSQVEMHRIHPISSAHATPTSGITEEVGSSGYNTPPALRSPRRNTQYKLNDDIPVVVQICHRGYTAHCHSFINFLFCPSLIYRWSYPTLNSRTSSNPEQEPSYKIVWKKKKPQFTFSFLRIALLSVVFYRILVPQFQNSPFEKLTLSHFLTSIFTAAIPGMLLIAMVSFGIMHCWLHAMSEVTGYCDRVFYEDWWNAQSFASYSKKWNLMIYYWSYNYFLLPMLEAGYSLAAADLLTFWLWAMLQEFVFTSVVGTFYPVLLVSCVIFGLTYYSIPFTDKGSLKYFHNKEQGDRDASNGEAESDGDLYSGFWTTLLWIVLFLQNGFIITLYARECRAVIDERIMVDENSWLPYSWQTAWYPNGTMVTGE